MDGSGHGHAAYAHHQSLDFGKDDGDEEAEKPLQQSDGLSNPPPASSSHFHSEARRRFGRDEFSADDTKGKKLHPQKDDSPSPAFCTPLVAPPIYPNSVKWSEDNLIAVATSQLITILNPASIEGPRGFLTASSQPQFHVGRIEASGLLTPCVLPICLSRDVRAVVRCMEWSPQGLAPSGGCLLAVCTKDHRVKLYRAPYCEFQSEWVEVLDLSEILYKYNCQNRFTNADQAKLEGQIEEIRVVDVNSPSESWHAKGKRSHRSSEEPEHRKAQKCRDESLEGLDAGVDSFSAPRMIVHGTQNVYAGTTKTTQAGGEIYVKNAMYSEEGRPSSRQNGKAVDLEVFEEGKEATSDATCVEALEQRRPLISKVSTEVEGTFSLDQSPFSESVPDLVKIDLDKWSNSYIAPSTYAIRTNMLAYVVVAWSSTLKLDCLREDFPRSKATNMALIAVGAKSGEVSVLRAIYPQEYTLEKPNSVPEVSLVGIFQAHNSWITAICWGKEYTIHYKDDTATGYEVVFLATGSCDGSVSVWVGDAADFSNTASNSGAVPICLIRKVLSEDSIPVTSISVQLSPQPSKRVLVAVGKASGALLAVEIDGSGKSCREASRVEAHSLMVTGVVWALGGRCLYTCGQDNGLCAWTFGGSELVALPFPKGSVLVDSESSDPLSGLPNSVLDGFFGLDLSKGSLALATLRGVSTEMLDPMYQSRSIKAAAQIFWVGGQHSMLESMNMSAVFQTMGCQIPALDLVQWDFNLRLALQHFENSSVNLVLWDVVACLMSLKTLVGRRFLNLVVTRWLLRLGLVVSESQEDEVVRMFIETNLQNLSNVSSRCLHIISVIVRRLYMSGVNSLIDTDKIISSKSPSCSDQLASVSAMGDEAWQRLLQDVQQEIRLRLTHLTLSSVAFSMQLNRRSGDSYQAPDFVHVSCLLQWVLANSSEVSSHVLTLAHYICQGLKGYPQPEICSFCKGKVPFESVENGHCHGEGHKLLRCMFTLEILPLRAIWFCNCCARWASRLAPGSLFSLCSGHNIQLSKYRLASDDISQPFCPFCGILMQRLLPDCFLRLHLV